MKFCIETENLAIDTEEVSAHFYELCKQKAEASDEEWKGRYDNDWGTNLIWERPEGDILVIAVRETADEFTDFNKKLEEIWSTNVDFWIKSKELDDLFMHEKSVTLIKIYLATTNAPHAPYWFVKKNQNFGITERRVYYKKLDEDASDRDDFFEWENISRLQRLEGVPCCGSLHEYELDIIREYKRLEEHTLLPSVQVNGEVNPTPNASPQQTQLSQSSTQPKQKVCKKYNFSDPNVKLKIITWLKNSEPTLSGDKKFVCDWIEEILDGKDWQDILNNPKYDTYKKQKKEKQKSNDSRYFEGHVRSKTTALLKKIMESTPVKNG